MAKGHALDQTRTDGARAQGAHATVKDARVCAWGEAVLKLRRTSCAFAVALFTVAATPLNAQPISVLVVESNDWTTHRRGQLANKFVLSAGTNIAGTGNFTLASLGPTGLLALTCSQIQTFDVVYAPIAFSSDTTSRNAIRDNPAFGQCFAGSGRAVIAAYHAEDHGQPATGQFLFDALTWIAGISNCHNQVKDCQTFTRLGALSSSALSR